MRSYLVFAAWSVLAGIGIPLIGALNSGIARSVGNPFAATAVMFAVAAWLPLDSLSRSTACPPLLNLDQRRR